MEPFTLSPSSITNLKDKVILITGGSSGIGLATAELLLSLSPTNKIAILDLSPPLKTSAVSLPQNADRCLFQRCNVTKWRDLCTAFSETVLRFGRLDAVYANAGVAEYGDQFFEHEVDEVGQLMEPDRRVYDVDFRAVSDTVRLGIYWMQKTLGTKTGGKCGSIVIGASLTGYLTTAGAPMYSAAKHGIVGLMRALKTDAKPLNIAISLVAAGITVTPILSSSEMTKGIPPAEVAAGFEAAGVPINQPESVALAVAHLISAEMKGSGQGLMVQGGKMVDVEYGLARTRGGWMGEEMLRLFRRGRRATVFDNKL